MIGVEVISDKGIVPPEMIKLEDLLKTRGVPVRAIGTLRSRWLFVMLCLNEDNCIGNGFYHEFPAILELQSIQLLTK